jgi:hypothetical protein
VGIILIIIPGFVVAGSTANLALQQRLGLLPERGSGSGTADFGGFGSERPIITQRRSRNSLSEAAASTRRI